MTANQAIATLQEMTIAAENTRAEIGPEAAGVRRGRDAYLRWAEDTEWKLRGLFADRDLIAALQSERYWRIHELVMHSARPAALINAEIDTQAALLRGAMIRLEAYRELASRPGIEVLVLDTNAFLHCTLFTDIDWCAEFHAESVRLVLPLLVLDELDDKTFSANNRLAKRASKVLRLLAPSIDDAIDPGVTRCDRA